MVGCPKRPGHEVKSGTWEHAVAKLSERVDRLDSRVTALDDPDFQVKETPRVNGQDVKPVECVVCGKSPELVLPVGLGHRVTLCYSCIDALDGAIARRKGVLS